MSSSEDVAASLYNINGTRYWIENPNTSNGDMNELIVWNSDRMELGELRNFPLIQAWLQEPRNLAMFYHNLREIPVSPSPERTMQMDEHELGGAPAPNQRDDIDMSEMTYLEPMVNLDELTAMCVYHFNANTQSFMQTQSNVMYPYSSLTCATPAGFINISQLTQGLDFQVANMADGTSRLSLNPINIRGSAFILTKPSPDMAKRVVVTVPPLQLTANVDYNIPSNVIYLYIPNGSVPLITYRTDIVWTLLRIGANCQQVAHPQHHNTTLTLIDPDAMTVEFLETLDNVHITGDLQIPACPTERLIAARVATPDALVARIRELVNQLNRDLPTMTHDLFRLPYVYEINVQTNTCTKTPVNVDAIMQVNTERNLSYFPQDLYERYILPYEEVLIRNMLFQMMFVYEKRGQEFKRECPPHKMLFDFYLRRNSDQVVFHYDRTPFFEVSTLSLLFIMPDGVTRPGPHIVPLPTMINPAVPDGMYYTDPDALDDVTRVCTFQVKNGTCIMANNSVVSHSTPGMRQLFERGNQRVGWMSQDNFRTFNFPQMRIPEHYQQLMERTKTIPRSFIRM